MLSGRHTLRVIPTREAPRVFDKKQDAVPLAPIDVARLLDPPTVVVDDHGGYRTMRTGRLYARRGVDLKAGDKVPLPEGEFTVVEGPDLDFDHPMTGYDFRWCRFHIRRGG